MSDRWAVTLAAAVFLAALAAVNGEVRAVPLPAGVAVLALACVAHRLGPGTPAAPGPPAGRAGCLGGRRWAGPPLLCLGAALLTMSLAQRSLAGLTAPVPTGPVASEVTLVGDPAPDGHGGVTVDVRLAGRHLHGTARGAAATALSDRLAGERALVIGRLGAPGPVEARQRYRHLAGRLDIATVAAWHPGNPLSRAANGLRRTLARGAEVLPPRQRALLAGVTLGDDRDQPADMRDAFRAAGLTHLLAVSGENVAFALVIVAPVVNRLRFGPRLAVTLAVLAGFALLTRAEPSVLRATAMAAVAAVAAALGRPATARRTLALGVAGMLLVDPLLVTSLGFRLSVAGTAGIVVAAASVEAALPGPRWLAKPLAVTLSAQAAVAPLLVTAFGSVPVASLPANLLAVPAAGPIMVWGLTAGLAAGAAGGPAAQLLHLPTRILLAWLDGVARAAAGWPLGSLGGTHLAALAGLAALVTAVRRRPRGDPRARPHHLAGATATAATAIVSVGLLVVVTSAARAPAAGPGPHAAGPGATVWQGWGGAGVVVTLDGHARAATVLATLRAEGIRRVDVVVLRTDADAAADAAASLRQRWPALTILAPRARAGPASGAATASGTAAGPGPGAGADTGPGTAARPPPPRTVTPPPGTEVRVGGLRVAVTRNADGRLDARMTLEAPVDGPR